MRLLTLLAHTPAAKAFGWALFHFLWQGAALALLLALSFAVMRGARARYAAACVAMLGMVAAFAVTFALEYPRVQPIETSHGHLLAAAPAGDAANLPFAPAPAAPADPLPWVAPFWALGVLAFHLRSVGSWMAAERLKRRGVCAPPPEWQARLLELAQTLRISKPVRLLETCLADTPVVAGYLKPVILVPAGMLAGLPSEQLEAILIHELAHIRRHDYLVNLLQTFVEGLLFYHPAVWWVSSAIRTERENCCDDLAAPLSGGAHRYAVALAALEVKRSATNRTALAANGGSLVKRIRRLLDQPESPRAIWTPLFSAAVLTVAVAVTAAAWQSEPADKPTPSKPAIAAAPAALSAPASAAVISEAPLPVRRVAAAPLLAAVAEPAPAPAPLAADPQDDHLQKLRTALQHELARLPIRQTSAAVVTGPYLKWLNEDVAYIVTNEERVTYKSLATDADREKFIEQFWLRRDPTPGTPENEFKDEHYRRIAYANDRFTSSIPGWKTDRGRIYITYGPPDEIEDHSTDSSAPAPYQEWRYKFIEGVGRDVIIKFVDTNRNGEYRMTMDPGTDVQISAMRLRTDGSVTTAEGNAQLKSSTLSVRADGISYDASTGAVVTRGNGTSTGLQARPTAGRGGRGGSLDATDPSNLGGQVYTANGPGMKVLVRVNPGVNNHAPVDVILAGDSVAMAGNYDIIAEVVSGNNVAAALRDHITLSPETAAAHSFQYRSRFTLTPGAYTLNLVVKDPAGATPGVSVNFSVN